jgi:tetratricopeptide (TPR) repeat protein
MWTTQSIFVSSTFNDMEAERDYLRNFVFPALEERLRDRRVHVEWVDLRVGVATESIEEGDREARVLQVCLGEVERCRPFMIALLGDRYGWIPDHDRLREVVGAHADLFPRGMRPSVTAAEIVHGLWSNEAKGQRSFVYFRKFKGDPPHARMSPDEAQKWFDRPGSEAARSLAVLKRLLAERMPTGHISDYSAEWSEERAFVVGLEAFGAKVLEDLGGALELEAAAVPTAPPHWEQIERDALADFVEDRARDFVGRKELVGHLVHVATRNDPSRSICITGEAGSGKSALFGALYRQLQASDDLWILAHAAGASVRSRSVDAMLRRWISELSARLDDPNPLPENAEPQVIEATFASIINRTPAQSRVVLLIDALDQFENTSRARSASWLPRSLPANVRLIATATPGDASGALHDRAGVETIALPPLDIAEAREIITTICRRYHRTFEPEVVKELLARRDGERPTWSNPLWLVLAVEDLNLIDAVDLARARRLPGGGGAQIRDLMRDMVAHYPTDISGLYAHTFERAEVHVGTTATRAFLRLIAVSRAGWREQDFAVLLERANGKPRSALEFAQLRRMFRGQLHPHGDPPRWDFNHAQMRQAVRAKLLRDDDRERELHALIAYHLLDENVAEDDPLRCSETMFHLLACESWQAAAIYYGDAALSAEASAAASEVLVDAITIADDHSAAASRIARMLTAPVEDAVRGNAAHRLLIEVAESIKGRAPLAAQQRLIAAIETALARVLASFPDDMRGLRDLSACRILAGDAAMATGHRVDALSAYRSGLAIAEEVSRDHPDDDLMRSYIVINGQRVGDALVVHGHLDEALETYRRSVVVADDLVARNPSAAMLQCAQALSLQKVGECLLKQDAADEALTHFELSARILEDVIAQHPSMIEAQVHLAQNYLHVGLISVGVDGERAIAMLLKCLDMREQIAAADPHDLRCQREVAVTLSLVGDAYIRFRHDAEAHAAYRRAVAIFVRTAHADPQNLEWRHDLSLACRRLAEAELRAYRSDEAMKLLRKATALGEALVEADPANPGWRESLAESCDVLSFVLRGKGEIAEANATDERSAQLRGG